ncbi:MAG: KpsF/GutQ family sugar-phosphate isomerase [Deltaproteobacteria bacterium]|nr:KpsF/GutQ family sugar-phosphate isomerase [Deltaproteobacteria bacterium]
MKKDPSIRAAERVLDIESRAVKALKDRLDSDFSKAVDMVLAVTGKVVVSGMGKSGIVGQKIASTLASTGTPAFFLHPAEGVHGDLGMIMRNDILIAISNSGETEELIKIIPVVKRLGAAMIAMTGKKKSTLAMYAEAVLDVGVKEEACPLGLSPTASTTACLAMGDALAVALLEKRGFKAEDFASLHPAGSLGRRLMKVEDLMHSGKNMPAVPSGTRMRDAIIEMTGKRMGLTGVFKGRRLSGIITDGDLRRALEKGTPDLLNKTVDEVMTRNPRTIGKGELAEAALKKMEVDSITSLFVLDGLDAVGVVHMHDLIRAGVV